MMSLLLNTFAFSASFLLCFLVIAFYLYRFFRSRTQQNTQIQTRTTASPKCPAKPFQILSILNPDCTKLFMMTFSFSGRSMHDGYQL